jgi:hypothetical protein
MRDEGHALDAVLWQPPADPRDRPTAVVLRLPSGIGEDPHWNEPMIRVVNAAFPDGRGLDAAVLEWRVKREAPEVLVRAAPAGWEIADAEAWLYHVADAGLMTDSWLHWGGPGTVSAVVFGGRCLMHVHLGRARIETTRIWRIDAVAENAAGVWTGSLVPSVLLSTRPEDGPFPEHLAVRTFGSAPHQLHRYSLTASPLSVVPDR